MIGWLKKIIFILFIILIVTFIVINNQTDTNLTFWPNKVIQAGLGIVIITSFLVGFFIASIIGSYVSFKSFLKEQGLKKKNNKSESINEKIKQAQIFTCLGEDIKAIRLWNDLKKEKKLIIPYVELSKIYSSKNDFSLSLNILKEGLKVFPKNEELLFHLANINEKLGNDASCLDNYASIFDTKPCVKIATLARDVAIKINQFNDALEYQRGINSLAKSTDDATDKTTDIRFLKILKENSEGSEDRKNALEELHKSVPSHIDTALTLSDILLKNDDRQGATQVLTKLALNIKKAFVWRKIAKIWLMADEPKKAISSVNTALKETDSFEHLKSYFVAIETFMSLSMLDDAREYFQKMEDEIKEQNLKLNKNDEILINLLYSILLNNKNFKNLDFFNIIDR